MWWLFCSFLYFWSINPHYFLFLIRVPEQTTFFCCTPPALLHSSNCLSDSTSNGASESCVLCSTHKGVTCSLSSTLPVGFFPERLLQNFLCSLFLAKSRTLHFCSLHVYVFWDDFRLHRWLFSVCVTSKHGVRCGFILTMSKLLCKDMRVFMGYKLQVWCWTTCSDARGTRGLGPGLCGFYPDEVSS